MSKGHKKKPRAQHKPRQPAGIKLLYERACELAEQGQFVEAQRIYDELARTETRSPMKALLRNDRAALAAQTGDTSAALLGFREALQIDPDCEPAQANLSLLEADLEMARADVLQPVEDSHAGTGPVRVAILSFLFNWPSTGGGNVHTAELALYLSRAGYDVRHFYVRYAPWRVGEVSNTPFPSDALEFDDASWNVRDIQARVRKVIEAHGPDYVIITDSWNIKPILAEAVRGYRYILRLQAMECLCPLNNLRLLTEPDGRARQCHLHQLATPEECRRCLGENGAASGALHQAERELSGVGTPEYHQLLLRSLREAEAVLVVNPLTEAIIGPYTRCVRVVTAGMDPDRFPWPQACPPSRNPCLYGCLIP
jgi:hypothetical protein